MRFLLAAILLALIGLVGARVAFPATSRSLGVRLFFSSGTHFLLLGFLLGPHAADLINDVLFASLSPFIMLGLGWVGLLFGVQFDREALARFPLRAQLAGFAQAAVTLVVVAVPALLLLDRGGDGSPLVPALVLAAGAVACVASPTGTAIVFGSGRVAGPNSRFLALASSLDGSVGILALGAAFSLFLPVLPGPEGALGPLRGVVVATLLGVLFGLLFLSLTRERPASEELMLLLIGVALILAGTNLSLASSVLLGSAVTGALIANLSPIGRRTYAVLVKWEKPIHVIFLLLAGGLLSFPGWQVLPLALGYLALRAAGKLAGGWVAGRWLRAAGLRPGLGAGLLSQGGLSIAMAVSVTLAFRTYFRAAAEIDLFFAAVVLGVAINELVGPPALRALLTRLGELREEPPARSVHARVAG